MRSVETQRANGAILATLVLPLMALLGIGIPRTIQRADYGGVALLTILLAVAAMGAVWAIHLLWFRKTITLDDRVAHVELRTLRRTVTRSTPLERFEAIVQVDSQIRWWKYSALLLPDLDRRFSICLALVPRNSNALAELARHFSKLLGLPKSQDIWETP